MATNTREVTLRAFFIKSTLLSKNNDEIFAKLEKRLQNSVVEDRIMLLNQEDETTESDLMSFFSNHKTNLFATMMRIAPGADDTHIDGELMKKECFSINEVRKKSNNAAAIYRNHYYICINNTHLVTNLPLTTTIKRVENYINWLLETHIYEIIPIVIPAPDLKFSDIKTVKFANPASLNSSSYQDKEKTQSKIISVTKEYVDKICKQLFADSSSLKDIDLNQVISAELILKLTKPREMSDEEFQKKFGAIMKPVSDTDNITFHDKKGNKIKGEDILKTKKITVDKTEQGWLSEPQLRIEMARFLDELAL